LGATGGSLQLNVPRPPSGLAGFFLSTKDSVKKTKVAVFLDWQNVYHHAREAFGLKDQPTRFGSISPFRIAQTLAARGGRGAWGELVRVEVHRGFPSPRRQPDANRAVTRQNTAWKAESPLVHPIFQNLRYRTVDGKVVAEEKGVDVRLAINAVEYAVTRECDLAIVFSHDTDLLPVVDVISKLRGSDCVETASWLSDSHRKQLPPRPGVINHGLGVEVFNGVEDSTDYLRASRKPRA
jgi:uncharacterized LabA/DUF88 family protein